jgi:hypothetical protein
MTCTKVRRYIQEDLYRRQSEQNPTAKKVEARQSFFDETGHPKRGTRGRSRKAIQTLLRQCS